MSPEQFAAQTGLSLEEAEMVLRRRELVKNQEEAPSKLKQAFEALAKAQKKVGVKPYEESK